MVIRKLIEATEEKILAPWAQKSAAAVREHEAVVEEQKNLMTCALLISATGTELFTAWLLEN